MTNHRWTFVCVAEDEHPVRQFSVSARALCWATSLSAAAVTVLAGRGMLGFLQGSARWAVEKIGGQKVARSGEGMWKAARVGQRSGAIRASDA